MLPTTDFFGTQITRMILGDNPANGNTYIPDLITREEMLEYYTVDAFADMLRRGEELGYNTFLPLASPHTFAALRKFRAGGGKLNLIFQTYPQAIDRFADNVKEMLEFGPAAIYHQGSTADYFTETDGFATLFKNLETLRRTGLPVGMASHVPETILRAEAEGWDVDFYTACLYNSRRTLRGQQSSFITGASKANLKFYPEDRFEMYSVIRRVPKPFVVIKIFAGGQVFTGHDPVIYPAVAEKYIAEAYENIKPCDVTCVGAFQRDKDQLAENAGILKRVLRA